VALVGQPGRPADPRLGPDQPPAPARVVEVNPVKFFALQLLMILGWLISFGSLAFVIVSGDNILTVLQGWSSAEPFQIDMGA